MEQKKILLYVSMLIIISQLRGKKLIVWKSAEYLSIKKRMGFLSIKYLSIRILEYQKENTGGGLTIDRNLPFIHFTLRKAEEWAHMQVG